MNRRNRREAPTIAQAVHIDHRARSRRRFRDCRDEDTATAADQKITGARSEPVILDQRPIIRPNLEYPFEVRNHTRTVATAERASARPQRIVFWLLRKSKTHMNITAVTPAQMVHHTRPNSPWCLVSGMAVPVSRVGRQTSTSAQWHDRGRQYVRRVHQVHGSLSDDGTTRRSSASPLLICRRALPC
jgi:hypothetical protein